MVTQMSIAPRKRASLLRRLGQIKQLDDRAQRLMNRTDELLENVETDIEDLNLGGEDDLLAAYFEAKYRTDPTHFSGIRSDLLMLYKNFERVKRQAEKEALRRMTNTDEPEEQ
jgi:hypothetical protein